MATKPSLAQVPVKDITVKSGKRSVYLSFERLGDYEAPCGEEKRPGVWLRLNNNTKWAIFVEGRPAKETSKMIISFNLADGNPVRGVSDSTEMLLLFDIEAVSQSRRMIPIEVPIPKQSPFCSYKWSLAEVRPNRGFWIAPGKSVLFSVPKDFLTDVLRINTQYNYEWESEGGQIKSFEPHHLVYFYGEDLPKNSN